MEQCDFKICLLTCGNGIFGVLGVFAGYFHKDLVLKTLKDYVHVEFVKFYLKNGFISTFNPMVKFPRPKNEKYRNWHDFMRKADIANTCL